MHTNDSYEYIPGVCNLGPAETKARWLAAIFGMVLSLGALVVFALVDVAWYLKLFIFLPASVGAVSTYQGVAKFCVKFGFQGVFNVSADVGKTETVEQAEFRRLDRAMAIRIIVVGNIVAMLVTLLALQVSPALFGN